MNIILFNQSLVHFTTKPEKITPDYSGIVYLLYKGKIVNLAIVKLKNNPFNLLLII